MTRLNNIGHTVDMKILDNESRQTYRSIIEDKWDCKYQLVPPDVHFRNAFECEIWTFKEYFLSILAGFTDSFPNLLWDQLILQTKLTLDPPRQSTITLTMPAWEHYHRPFNFDATPMVPIGRPIIIHKKSSNR